LESSLIGGTPLGTRKIAGAIAAAALLLLLAAAASPAALAAQTRGPGDSVAGRWRIALDGAGAPQQGDLRLDASGPRLTGQLLLESMDSGPLPVSGRILSDGTVQFTVALPDSARFAGHLEGNRLEGVVEGAAPRSWSGERIPPTLEFYAALPRFTLHQLVAGRSDSLLRLPGPWLAAARATPGLASVLRDYAALADRAAIRPLDAAALGADGQLRLFGLGRRSELLGPLRATLDSIRGAIPSDSVRARFDYLFRPRGAWIVDLPDAALFRARLRIRALTWDAAMPALRAAGRVSADARAEDAVPLALYRLVLLRSTDSAAVEDVLATMRRTEPASAGAVAALLDGYREAEPWYLAAVEFLLAAPWIPEGGGRSPADLVRRLWREDAAALLAGDSLPLPALRLQLFGYPQAVPRYGVPRALFDALVAVDNWSASQWLARHGPSGVLAALHELPADSGPATTVSRGDELLRLTSVRRQAQESTNGFLEPQDAVVLDPGYEPLFALGTVVHEWQHLILERLRLAAVARAARGARTVRLGAADPYLAEGFAEWQTERALAPAAARWPLVALGEAEKRARLAAADSTDPHVLGYLLFRAAAAVAAPLRFVPSLVRHADDAVAFAAAPPLAGRWPRYARAPRWTHRSPSRQVLVPETTFTVEDGVADLVSSRILQP
jgi:hypothetical protein